MTLEKKIKDHERIMRICSRARKSYGDLRQRMVVKIYDEAKIYYERYGESFVMGVKPKK
ncbi:MAG: hypothetical protein IH845_05340 [Nanoarchaeota archaeon]|nr:hypothetical protein [Nanoarchaeota archaeon]